jgi:hypothetical protein
MTSEVLKRYDENNIIIKTLLHSWWKNISEMRCDDNQILTPTNLNGIISTFTLITCYKHCTYLWRYTESKER